MSGNSPESFEQRVTAALETLTQDEGGKWQLPEEVKQDEALSFAVMAERRRRDTQSAYTRAQVELKQKEAEATLLLQGWESDFVTTLPTDQQADLAELKVTDPDAWRLKLQELEKSQRETFQQRTTEIAAKASKESEAEYRNRVFAEFSEANPTLKITDDVLANDIPPRITRQLENGEVDFATFLANCKDYLERGRVITPGAQAPNMPNIGKVPGSSAPGGDATAAAASQGYDEEIY